LFGFKFLHDVCECRQNLDADPRIVHRPKATIAQIVQLIGFAAAPTSQFESKTGGLQDVAWEHVFLDRDDLHDEPRAGDPVMVGGSFRQRLPVVVLMLTSSVEEHYRVLHGTACLCQLG